MFQFCFKTLAVIFVSDILLEKHRPSGAHTTWVEKNETHKKFFFKEKRKER